MLHCFLSVEVTYNVIRMHLYQHKFMKELLDTDGLLDVKPLTTLMSSGNLLNKVDGHFLVDPSEYQMMVGFTH